MSGKICFVGLCYLLMFIIKGGDGFREEDCIEVGFARASFINIDAGYQEAKQKILPIWEEEDKSGKPTFKLLSQQMRNISRAAELLEETTKNVIDIIRKTRVGKRCQKSWLLQGLEKHVQPLIQLDKELAENLGLVMSFRCLVGSPYPNVDGTCINEQGPDMGANGGKFLRLMPPNSAKDGFALRSSVNVDKTLPSAREVANSVRRHMPKLSTSHLFSEFSEFIAADTFNVPFNPHLEGVDCCDESQREIYEDCEPIMVGSGDPLYSTLKCIDYKRSIKAQAILGHRESLSLISTYFDATPMYGSTNEEAFHRKSGYFGYLKTPESLENEELDTKAVNTKCDFPNSFKGCFRGLKEQDKDFFEGLRLLLILEHNRIADNLVEINPHFDDALLYNEARRINIAQYSAIIFGEFIPVLLGSDITEKHSLRPGSEGPGTNFISEVNPGILTSFALGAYRNPSVTTLSENKKEFSEFVSLASYETIAKDPVKDFLAIDIQRGRDHGLPGYIHWRRFCDPGRPIDNFEDLAPLLMPGAAEDLKSLYGDELLDLDILVALLEIPEKIPEGEVHTKEEIKENQEENKENPEEDKEKHDIKKEDGVVGKTFTCILADQYARLKTGNRLHWEHESSMLTTEQKDSIRTRSSASGLLCRHFHLEKVLKNPFKMFDETENPEILCKDIVELDLEPWIDTSLIEVMKKVKEEEAKKKQEKRLADKKTVSEENEEVEEEEVIVGEEEDELRYVENEAQEFKVRKGGIETRPTKPKQEL